MTKEIRAKDGGTTRETDIKLGEMTVTIGAKDGELMAGLVLIDGSRPNTLAKGGKHCSESVSF